MSPSRVLEWGLALLVALAPLPFGGIGPGGRLAIEVAALVLTAIWSIHAWKLETPLPPRLACAGLLGLLAVAAAQLVPWTGVPLSVAPDATASALRTGAALAGTMLVATSVVAWRGGRLLALALLLSAAFQGLYGLLVLASGHPIIWLTPKTVYLDSATGTFVNRNNFAAYLAAALPPALGLVIAAAKGAKAAGTRGPAVLTALGDRGSRAILLGLAAVVALAGLLLSFSRAGTALGFLAVAATIVVVLRGRPVRGALLAGIVLAIAAVPLVEIGADRLAGRYAATGEELTSSGGRVDVWRDTLAMTATRPLLGFGFGAYTWAFPGFRSPEVRLHYTYAHQDLLQLGAEGGVVALALLGLIVVPLGLAIARILARNDDPVAVGACFGLCALLLHALVDFPFHMPADALLGCALSGWIFGAGWRQPGLRLVPPTESGAAPSRAAAMSGLAVLAAALLATALGADRGRTPFDAREIAEFAVARELAAGDASAVPAALARLTVRLRGFPRDAATRTIYASLLAASGDPAAHESALREAHAAVLDDPMGLGVRRAVAQVEVACGRPSDAAAEVRAIFGFDAGAAAVALSDVLPLLSDGQVEAAIPATPTAWRAWSVRLREMGREQDADARLAALLARWPDDLAARTIAGGVAAGRGRIDELARVVPPDLAVPDDADHAMLVALRARSRASAGDAPGARADAARAIEVSGGDPWVTVQAGDAVVDADPLLAHDWWTRALFALAAERPVPGGRVWVAYRVARLDERLGRAADALRIWREIAALRPDSDEARARIQALAGGAQR